MITIDSSSRIIIDEKPTGYYLTQRESGTVIYTVNPVYCEHTMPATRYSAAHYHPASGVAGRADLEKHIRHLIDKRG